MSDNFLEAQYFRSTTEGNVAIEGRSSNGLILDNNGNSFLLSGLNSDDLIKLQKQNYQGTIDINANNNSFIGVLKNSTQNIILGSTNYTTFNHILTQNANPIKIITPVLNITSLNKTEDYLPTIEPKIQIENNTLQLAEGETIVEFLPDREDQQDPNQLYNVDDLPRHKIETTNIWLSNITSTDLNIKDINFTSNNISFNDVNNVSLISYLIHQQGSAGLKAILYYANIGANRVPKNSFTSEDVNLNMFGKKLYPNSSSLGNVGDNFEKLFGKNYTPANFLKYWILTFRKKYNGAQSINKYDSIFIPLSKKFNVPLDLIKTICNIESGFNPNNGNNQYKGLFAISIREFKEVYPNDNDIYNDVKNINVGVQAIKKYLLKVNNVLSVIK
jgi:hypothetical protein